MQLRSWCKNGSGPVACFALVLGLSQRTSAEKADLSPAELRKVATHVIIGNVVSIQTRTEERPPHRYTRYVAQVRINRVEKGAGLREGDVCPVRYWHRVRLSKSNDGSSIDGKARRPRRKLVGYTETSGHRGLPKAGDTLRIYLAQNAYDGFGYDNNDGGFNVIGANGFQKLSGAAKGVR